MVALTQLWPPPNMTTRFFGGTFILLLLSKYANVLGWLFLLRLELPLGRSRPGLTFHPQADLCPAVATIGDKLVLGDTGQTHRFV